MLHTHTNASDSRRLCRVTQTGATHVCRIEIGIAFTFAVCKPAVWKSYLIFGSTKCVSISKRQFLHTTPIDPLHITNRRHYGSSNSVNRPKSIPTPWLQTSVSTQIHRDAFAFVLCVRFFASVSWRWRCHNLHTASRVARRAGYFRHQVQWCMISEKLSPSVCLPSVCM